MLRLLTLGGTAIVDDARDDAGVATSQRRTLALLAVLAVSGRVGLSRDKLVALFWPEADSERGRHALTQALYAARRAVGCDDLFLTGADVRLNPERITSDVEEFEAALASHPEQAVSLYRGPFLDGFFLPGAGEFEQWTTAQRGRIEAHCLQALERLAAAAAEAGDARQSAEWWRRAAALRPLDSGIARHYMESLAAAGDRAGALRHASVHRSLLRAELDLEPDASLVELEAALREPELRPDAAVGAVARPGAAVQPESNAAPSTTTVEPSVAPSRPYQPIQVWAPPRPHGRGWQRPWRVAALLAAVLLLVATGVAIGLARRPRRAIQPLADRQAVVVAPFRVSGASASLRYLRDGMVELLSTRLADDSVAHSVDAGAVIGAWNAAGLAPDMDVPRDTVVHLAARLGAERVVVGGIVGTQHALVIRATVLRVPGGAVAADATVQGSADSVTTLVDRLAARLLLAEAGEDAGLAKHMTSSLTALRAFLAGQAALRANDYSAAARDYERALARDSTFALAALRLAIAADRVDEPSIVRRGIRTAWTFRDQLVERDRALLLGFTGARYPAPPLAVAQPYAWRRATEIAPASAEAWLALAMHLVQEGALAGVPDPRREARGALRRSRLLDSTDAAAARWYAQLADAGDAGQAPAAPPARAGTDSTSAFAPFIRWHAAAVRGDSAALRALRALRARFAQLGPANLRAIALASQFDALAPRDGARAIAILRARHASRAAAVDALLGAHALALDAGRLHDAATTLAALRAHLPGSHVDLRLTILDALYDGSDGAAARAAAGRLEALVLPLRPDSLAPGQTRSADLCVLGQWWLTHARSAAVPGIVAELRRAGATDGGVPVAAAPAACAELLDAGVAVAARRADARSRLARLDSLALTPATAGDLVTYAPLWIARLHRRMRDPRGALAAIRRRQYMVDWPRYLASMLREEAQLAGTVGDAPGAREAYRRYAVLRGAPLTAPPAE